MNKIKSVHPILYSPANLKLHHSFIYLLNNFKILNQQHFIPTILHSLAFTKVNKGSQLMVGLGVPIFIDVLYTPWLCLREPYADW